MKNNVLKFFKYNGTQQIQEGQWTLSTGDTENHIKVQPINNYFKCKWFKYCKKKKADVIRWGKKARLKYALSKKPTLNIKTQLVKSERKKNCIPCNH